jgi:hypothetical protein
VSISRNANYPPILDLADIWIVVREVDLDRETVKPASIVRTQ